MVDPIERYLGGAMSGTLPDKAVNPTNLPATPPQNKQANLTEDIRIILGLANSDPALAEAWNAFSQERYDDMYAAIYRSNFYKNNTAIARNRQAAKERQPGAFQSEFSDWKLKTYKRLRSTGIKITPAIESQMEQAYLLGMSDDQIDSVLSQKGLLGAIGGEIGGEVTGLRNYASQFAVNKYYNDAYWEQVKKNIFDGTTTIEDEQQKIRDLSASMYPAWADNIRSGQSLAANVSYITTIVSDITGRPVTADSPEVQRFMQWKNPETGKFEQPPGWKVQQEAWSLPGADRTPAAIAKADSITRKILQDIGVSY
jgi:hypothetical protein